jgi:hypothetical protein
VLKGRTKRAARFLKRNKRARSGHQKRSRGMNWNEYHRFSVVRCRFSYPCGLQVGNFFFFLTGSVFADRSVVR